jgi:hypothetical protein
MADLTGAYTTPVPTISQNTASVIKYRANYVTGTALIALPLSAGIRYIITSVYTNGNEIKIGFGNDATGIDDERFTYTVTAGPLDLSNFFGNAPFTQYRYDASLSTHLVITGEAAKVITVAYVEFKG